MGAVSDPIATDNGSAVIKVLEKKEVTADEWTSSKDRFREEMLTDRRNRFFTAYMGKAKQKMKIDVNRRSAAARRVVDEQSPDAESLVATVTGRHRGHTATKHPAEPRSASRQRNTVKGIRASGSPRRNIVHGPRTMRSASISPLVRFAFNQSLNTADWIESLDPLICSDSSS